MTRADWVVLVLAASLIPMLYLHFWQGGLTADHILVQSEAGSRSLALDIDTTLTIAGPAGASVLEIRDRQVRFKDSPCLGKICMRGGWLAQPGSILACLPNRISVQIIGRDRRFDAVNF